VDNAAADSYGLEVALVWWSFGMLLTAGYFISAPRPARMRALRA
jgi:hypothetical protein